MKKLIFAVLAIAGCSSGFQQPESCKENGGGYLPDIMIMINAREEDKGFSDEELKQCFADSLAAMRAAEAK